MTNIKATGGGIWYGERTIRRLRGATNGGVMDTARRIRADASKFTYERWQRRSGFAGANWQIIGAGNVDQGNPEIDRAPAAGVDPGKYIGTQAGRASGGSTFSVQVGSTEKDKRGINYVVFLEHGWTDRAGEWNEGGHMLVRAVNANAGHLPRAVINIWNSGGTGGSQYGFEEAEEVYRDQAGGNF